MSYRVNGEEYEDYRGDHHWETCPVFGGCDECRLSKFEKNSPDVVFPRSLDVEDDAPHPKYRVHEPERHQVVGWDDENVDFRGYKPPMTAKVAAFNAAVNETLDRARGVSDQRGNEYQDSWNLDNQVTCFVDSVLAIPRDDLKGWKRLLIVAALIDVKMSRLPATWKRDTCDDMLNYLAAYTTWREAYENSRPVP